MVVMVGRRLRGNLPIPSYLPLLLIIVVCREGGESVPRRLRFHLRRNAARFHKGRNCMEVVIWRRGSLRELWWRRDGARARSEAHCVRFSLKERLGPCDGRGGAGDDDGGGGGGGGVQHQLRTCVLLNLVERLFSRSEQRARNLLFDLDALSARRLVRRPLPRARAGGRVPVVGVALGAHTLHPSWREGRLLLLRRCAVAVVAEALVAELEDATRARAFKLRARHEGLHVRRRRRRCRRRRHRHVRVASSLAQLFHTKHDTINTPNTAGLN
mmetsp:Transcript_3006/g.6236  ORF Transcript_3006/g.6236 Transcript_3006/m.6236 type:complete len:271 (+) Transcript_3006:74-886(+)